MDFHTAAAFRIPPSFQHVYLDVDTPPFPEDLLEEAVSTSPTSLLRLSIAAVDCFNIFYQLHRLALAASSRWSGRVARLTLSNVLYETQFIILSVPDYSRVFLDFDQDVDEEHRNDFLHRSYRADAASVVEGLLAAMLIYVYAVLRGLPLNAKIFTILLSRLRATIHRPMSSAQEVWEREHNLHILVWVLVIACSVAPSTDRTWWIIQLSKLCEAMELNSQTELEDMMRHVAWTDVFFDGRMNSIWAEVIRLRRSGSYSEPLMQTATSVGCHSMLESQTSSSGNDWTSDERGYSRPVDFEDGRWKVDNWYV